MPRKGVSHRRQLPWSHGSLLPLATWRPPFSLPPDSHVGPSPAWPTPGSHPSSLLRSPSFHGAHLLSVALRSSVAVEEKPPDPQAPPPPQLFHPHSSPPRALLSANGRAARSPQRQRPRRAPSHAEPHAHPTQPHATAAGTAHCWEPGLGAGLRELGGARARTRTVLRPGRKARTENRMHHSASLVPAPSRGHRDSSGGNGLGRSPKHSRALQLIETAMLLCVCRYTCVYAWSSQALNATIILLVN